MKIRLLLVCSFLMLLASAGLGISPAGAASAQTPEGELMPLVGKFTLWCTWSNPGGPCDGANPHHTTPALDFAANFGEPVFAAADGVVVELERGCAPDQNDGCNKGAGNHIIIDHGTRRSRYLHLSTIEISRGPVAAGDRIGTTGNSGSTHSAHLHYDEVADGSYSDRIPPGKLLACHGDKVVAYPHVLGYKSWGKTPYGSLIRNDGYGCLIPGWTEPSAPSTTAVTPPTGRYVPLSPKRLFDTRSPKSPFGRLGAGEDASVTIDRTVDVPNRAIAVVLNVTAVDADDDGYLTIWPGGSKRPKTSSLNVSNDRHTVANLVTVPIGRKNRVSFYPSVEMDIVADIAGYYVGVKGQQSAGRFVPMSPTRLLDTRIDNYKRVDGRTVKLKVAGTSLVPANADAVVINLTATESVASGFVTAWPTGSGRPLASNLNPVERNDTVPNMAIVAVGAAGHISLFTSTHAELVVDITGYVTGDGAEASRSGLFVPVQPYRWFDTRTAETPSRPVAAQHTVDVSIARRGQLPRKVGAVALNVTATDALDRGYVTVWPSAVSRPVASTLNLGGPLDTRPNASYLPLGTDDALSYYSQSGTDLVTDVFGYFTP